MQLRPAAALAASFYFALWARSQAPVPVFRASSYLQSVAVEVTDKQGNGVRGLARSDFNLFEDGHPQKIAFFGTEDQPISLTILLDSKRQHEIQPEIETRARVAAAVAPRQRSR
jgi:hypothetical protein